MFPRRMDSPFDRGSLLAVIGYRPVSVAVTGSAPGASTCEQDVRRLMTLQPS
jgi:hypothetical protein